jgi:GNAT superfamily N-acetyltransferase
VSDAVVRQATTDDVAELAAMRRAFAEEDPPSLVPRPDFEEEFEEVVGAGLRDGSWVVWVVDVEGESASHAFVCVIRKVPTPVETPKYIGYLTNVYTRPSHRGRGLGGRLLEAVTEWAVQAGIELLVVWPSEESLTLYRRHGFSAGDEPLVWPNP